MCAGSIHTPQIMQLSGFGPADQLKKMGIPVTVDLPGVGQNMVVSAGLRSLQQPYLPGMRTSCATSRPSLEKTLLHESRTDLFTISHASASLSVTSSKCDCCCHF